MSVNLRRARFAIAGAVAAAMLLAGCAKSSSTSGTTAKAAADSAAASGSAGASSCGPASSVLPADPDGVLAALPPAVRAGYGGYPETVHKSAYAAWKPSHAGAYKVGILWSQLVNAVQTEGLAQVQAAVKSIPGATATTLVTSSGSLTDQLQQYDSLVQQGMDIIIAEPLAPAAFAPKIQAAAAKGIPTVTLGGSIDSAYAINLATNTYLDTQKITARLVSTMGGRGAVLVVRGVAGFTADTQTGAAIASTLKSCAGVSVAGTVVGDFSPAVAKSAVLQFLATHPGPIAGVAQVGTMGTGIIDAFTQAGRPVPPVTEPNASAGPLAYWQAHESSYHGVGASYPNAQVAVTDLLRRMFAGNDPKLSDLLMLTSVPITSANLSQFVMPGWTESTSAVAEAPSSLLPAESAFDSFFAKAGQAITAGTS